MEQVKGNGEDSSRECRARMGKAKRGDNHAHGKVRGLRPAEYGNTVVLVNQGHCVTEEGKKAVSPLDAPMRHGTMSYRPRVPCGCSARRKDGRGSSRRGLPVDRHTAERAGLWSGRAEHGQSQ